MIYLKLFLDVIRQILVKESLLF